MRLIAGKYGNYIALLPLVIMSRVIRGIVAKCFQGWNYRITGNFRGVQFSWMANLQSFRGLIFADACDHAHYTLHNRTYFAGLIFADSRLSLKIRPHENFPLYGIPDSTVTSTLHNDCV
jgi:hypothetical protein